MKVKIKKYWKVYSYYMTHTKGEKIEMERIVGGKTPQQAVENFYNSNFKWNLEKGFIISKIEKLNIEVETNDTNKSEE